MGKIKEVIEVSNNLADNIIARFKNRENEKDRKRTEKSFFVPKNVIVENGYELSINKYKKTEYITEEYPPTTEIIAELNELEMKVSEALLELRGMLDE